MELALQILFTLFKLNLSCAELLLGPDIPLEINQAYVDHLTLAKQIKEHHDVAVKKNEAYMEFIPDPRSGHEECIHKKS